MKLKNLYLLAIPLTISSCGVFQPAEVNTVKLGDAIISAAKEARRAGATKLTYTASVSATDAADAAVVVPIGNLSPGFGFSRNRTTTSKVVIDVPIQAVAKKRVSGEQYRLNLRTLNAQKIAP